MEENLKDRPIMLKRKGRGRGWVFEGGTGWVKHRGGQRQEDLRYRQIVLIKKWSRVVKEDLIERKLNQRKETETLVK